MEPNQIITTILASVGGSGVIIVGSVAFFGKIFSNSIIEAEKARHTIELEKLKSELEFERTRKQKISDEQFRLYTEVWHALQDLKTIADRLWEKATPDLLYELINLLSNTKQAVNRARLILREEHYQSLKEVLEHFENYRFGKQRLIEIRSKKEVKENYSVYNRGEREVTMQIRQNFRYKEKYDPLLDEIIKQFRLELGLSTLQPSEAGFLKDVDFRV